MRLRTLKLLLATAAAAVPALASALVSPDGRIQVDVSLDAQQRLVYRVQQAGKPVLLPSRLGLQLADADLSNNLRLVKTSPPRRHQERYQLPAGKRQQVSYVANEQRFELENPAGQRLLLDVRVSNDGLALRYTAPGEAGEKRRFVAETTCLQFAPDARAWLQPMSVAGTGWKGVHPSYEEHYEKDIPVGTPSPSPAGWVFPALFRTGPTWVALTEAGMDGSFHASRLQADSTGGNYCLGLPMAREVFTGGHLLAEADGTLVTPWRVIALGTLATLVESTLGTDLAPPTLPATARFEPGAAAWSWALLKDEATVFDVQKRFIDYAADMRWPYLLIDAEWDTRIGDAKLKELVDYARRKGVGVHVWYNSSGDWNESPQTPKSALLTPEARKREFSRLAEMGVKGVKIDFFGGDGASMQAYYLDLLRDTLAAGLMVNFHGATLPRGWARTFPNFMTAEAVKGFEFVTFGQADQDKVAGHAAMLPFTRNLFDPMDFTPMVFGDIPNIQRRTRNGFELAQAVLFLSGIQHFAEIPEGMATVPAEVKNLLRQLPRRWDETRFIAGEPGRYAVIARRAGKAWWVAGFNADDNAREVLLDAPFLRQRAGQLYTDGEGPRDFRLQPLPPAASTRLSLQPQGGFIARFP